MNYPNSFLDLIESLRMLPGVGNKTAERMAFDLLNMSIEDRKKIISSLNNLEKLKPCDECGNLTDEEKCSICKDEQRDHSLICVVHYSKDVYAFEKIKEYNGIYHVLNGFISPSKGKGVESINLTSLLNKIEKNQVKEVILATNLTIEGEMTAMYLAKILKEKNVKVTRLAHGLPMGAQLDYADEMTLFRAFSNRKEI